MTHVNFVGTIILLLALSALMAPAWADDSEDSMKLQCKAGKNQVSISPIADPNSAAPVQEVRWRSQGDCTLANGTAIRIKVTSVGDDCTLAFSLWVNRSKVLSLHPYWQCGPKARLTIGEQDIELCDFDSGKLPRGPVPPTDSPWDSFNRSLTCRHLPIPTAGAGDDFVEYPPPGVIPKGMGRSLVLSVSEDDRVCMAMKRIENQGRHEQEINPPDRVCWPRKMRQ